MSLSTVSKTSNGSSRLLLEVGVPRLARHAERVLDWIRRFDSTCSSDQLSELARLPGAEGLAALATLSQDERRLELERIVPTPDERAALDQIADQLGSAQDSTSPAAVLVRAFPAITNVEPETFLRPPIQDGALGSAPYNDPEFAEERLAAATTLLNSASADLGHGNYSAAREKSFRSIEIYQQLGDHRGVAAAWHNLGTIDLHQGNYDAAGAEFGRSLELLQLLGDQAGEAAVWHNLAVIDRRAGRYADALEKLGRSLAIKQTIGDLVGEAATWHQLAAIDSELGNLAPARAKLGRAQEIVRRVGDCAGEAAIRQQLAFVDLQTGNIAAAREEAFRALQIRQMLGDREGEAAARHLLASADLQEDNDAAAREHLHRALQIRQELRNHAGEAATLHQLAVIDLNEESDDRALEKLGRVLKICQEIGDRSGEAAAFNLLGVMAVRTGDASEGARLLAVSWMIDAAMGHGDATQDFETFRAACEAAGIVGEFVQALLQDATEGYQRDRGAGLLERTFGAGWDAEVTPSE